MANLSLREKAIIYLLALFVIAFLAYFFGIRTLNEAYEDLQGQLVTLQQQKEYLDQLKQNNIDTENAINEVKGHIIELEAKFISNIKTENLEQFVLKTMEENGIGFMSSVSSADVPMDVVQLADGSRSPDSVICRRVDITYASTDGFEITQFNTTPSLTTETGAVDSAVVQDIIARTGIYDPDNHYGYDEFLEGLRAIAKKDPDCIKVANLDVQSTNGYLTLTASIEFYGADLANRISSETKTAGYAVWKGDKNVDTAGGFIGMPYFVVNPDSSWNGVLINSDQVQGFQSRPFASYLSNALFTQMISQNGLDAVVGHGRRVVSQPAPTETPAEEPAA